MAMENGPVEDVFPTKNGGFSIAMLVYWRVGVNIKIKIKPHIGPRFSFSILFAQP